MGGEKKKKKKKSHLGKTTDIRLRDFFLFVICYCIISPFPNIKKIAYPHAGYFQNNKNTPRVRLVQFRRFNAMPEFIYFCL